MKEWLALTAAIINGLGYCLYFRQAKNQSSKPNIVSWVLWVLISGLDFVSYDKISLDLVLSLNFIVDTLGCAGILVYIFVSKNFYLRLKARDLVIFFLCVVAIMALHLRNNPVEANIIVCFASILSFLPTFEGVWRDREKETPLSWWVQTAAYFFMLLGVLSSNWEAMQLLAPAVLLILHAGIAILATQKNNK